MSQAVPVNGKEGGPRPAGLAARSLMCWPGPLGTLLAAGSLRAKPRNESMPFTDISSNFHGVAV